MIVFPNDVFGRLPFFLSLGVWVFFFFSGSLPVHPVILRVLAEEENTIFYGPPEDTVLVVVLLDSEGEILTGVEVFLKFDPRIFQALDSNPASGFQPAEAGLLSAAGLAGVAGFAGSAGLAVGGGVTGLGGSAALLCSAFAA